MLMRKVRALKDCEFKTPNCFRYLVQGEVFDFPFKNREELDEHIRLGTIELVNEELENERSIELLEPDEEDMIEDLELDKEESEPEEDDLELDKKEPGLEETEGEETTTSLEEELDKVEPETETQDDLPEVWNSRDGDKRRP